MKLRGIEFGNVLGASGVQGFFGEGYWFHHPWKPFGLDFTNMTFVSKTTTLFSRKGNMPLKADYTPKHLLPSCVTAKPIDGIMLNAVGLSGPGLGALIGTGLWQARTKPFFISIMSLQNTPEKRLEELRIMIDMLGLVKDDFKAPFGLQINLSCPNTDHDPKELIGETVRVLEVASKLGVPLMPKFSIASAPLDAVMELDHLDICDAICVSNTVPYNWVGWKMEITPSAVLRLPETFGAHYFGKPTSPLQHLGGGGISGAALRPMVCAWIFHARMRGFKKPINGGGGVMSQKDIAHYHHAGANSIFLGTVAMIRPWRVKGIIENANEYVWK